MILLPQISYLSILKKVFYQIFQFIGKLWYKGRGINKKSRYKMNMRSKIDYFFKCNIWNIQIMFYFMVFDWHLSYIVLRKWWVEYVRSLHKNCTNVDCAGSKYRIDILGFIWNHWDVFTVYILWVRTYSVVSPKAEESFFLQLFNNTDKTCKQIFYKLKVCIQTG